MKVPLRVIWFLLAIVALFGVALLMQCERTKKVSEERDRYMQNSDALLSDMKRMRIDSTTLAVDVKSLRLTVDEYERYRAEDAKKIEALGVKLKNLESVGKHELAVNAPIKASVRDTVMIKDTVTIHEQIVEMRNPYIEFRGVIDNDSLLGDLRIPVTLHQSVWIEYKRYWLFWKKPKAIHQTISSDNPYVDIEYSEWVLLK